MKMKLFTHTDLDGVGCAILMHSLFPESEGHVVDVTYCNYDKIDEKVQKYVNSKANEAYDFVFITDISVSEETADMLEDLNNSDMGSFVQLLDHHATAEWLNKFDWAFVSSVERARPNHKSSGTSLIIDFFEYQRPGFERTIEPAIRHFAETVRKYDTWEWATHYNETLPKELNDYLYMIGREEFANYMLHDVAIGEVEVPTYFDTKATALLDQKQKEIQAYTHKKNKQMIKLLWDTDDDDNDIYVGVVFAEQHVSELGNELCKKHEDILFAVMIDMGERKVSFRTVRDDIDLGKVAKKYGGGGHPKAAGAQFSDEQITDFLSELL